MFRHVSRGSNSITGEFISEDLNPTVPREKTPGFEVAFAIAGLLAVAYLLRRWRWNNRDASQFRGCLTIDFDAKMLPLFGFRALYAFLFRSILNCWTASSLRGGEDGALLYPQVRLSTHLLIPASELESKNEAPLFRGGSITYEV